MKKVCKKKPKKHQKYKTMIILLLFFLFIQLINCQTCQSTEDDCDLTLVCREDFNNSTNLNQNQTVSNQCG